MLLQPTASEILLGYWIASGKSPRGDFDHCVIYRGAVREHDPHPDGTFLGGPIKDCLVLIAIDPTQVTSDFCPVCGQRPNHYRGCTVCIGGARP